MLGQVRQTCTNKILYGADRTVYYLGSATPLLAFLSYMDFSHGLLTTRSEDDTKILRIWLLHSHFFFTDYLVQT